MKILRPNILIRSTKKDQKSMPRCVPFLNPFFDLQIPEAIIALKQGAGRLIRDQNDRGVLVLCDPRLIASAYGKRFLRSLPPMRRTREQKTVIEFLKNLTPD